jgi:hypothetical protein
MTFSVLVPDMNESQNPAVLLPLKKPDAGISSRPRASFWGASRGAHFQIDGSSIATSIRLSREALLLKRAISPEMNRAR